MNIRPALLSLFALVAGLSLLRAQTSQFRPVSFTDPEPSMLAESLVEEDLEAENLSRLQARAQQEESWWMEPAEESIESALRLGMPLTSLEEQLATLTTQYRRTLEEAQLAVDDPEWEGAEALLNREATLRAAKLALLEQQLNSLAQSVEEASETEASHLDLGILDQAAQP